MTRFRDFITEVKDLGLLEMIKAVEREATAVDQNLYQRRGAGQAAGGVEYRRLLRGFLFLLRYQARPGGVGEWELSQMRPAIESLVSRGILKPALMSVFGQLPGQPHGQLPG